MYWAARCQWSSADGLVGGSAEVVEVSGQVSGVGVDELLDASVDGQFRGWELAEVFAVFGHVLIMVSVLDACPCERVVETGEPTVEVVGLVDEDDSTRASVPVVTPPALGFDCLEVVADVGELFGDVVAPRGERVDLVRVRGWTGSVEFVETIAFVYERVEGVANRVAVDAGVDGEVLGMADGECSAEGVDRFGRRDFGGVGFRAG